MPSAHATLDHQATGSVRTVAAAVAAAVRLLAAVVLLGMALLVVIVIGQGVAAAREQPPSPEDAAPGEGQSRSGPASAAVRIPDRSGRDPRTDAYVQELLTTSRLLAAPVLPPPWAGTAATGATAGTLPEGPDQQPGTPASQGSALLFQLGYSLPAKPVRVAGLATVTDDRGDPPDLANQPAGGWLVAQAPGEAGRPPTLTPQLADQTSTRLQETARTLATNARTLTAYRKGLGDDPVVTGFAGRPLVLRPQPNPIQPSLQLDPNPLAESVVTKATQAVRDQPRAPETARSTLISAAYDLGKLANSAGIAAAYLDYDVQYLANVIGTANLHSAFVRDLPPSPVTSETVSLQADILIEEVITLSYAIRHTSVDQLAPQARDLGEAARVAAVSLKASVVNPAGSGDAKADAISSIQALTRYLQDEGLGPLMLEHSVPLLKQAQDGWNTALETLRALGDPGTPEVQSHGVWHPDRPAVTPPPAPSEPTPAPEPAVPATPEPPPPDRDGALEPPGTTAEATTVASTATDRATPLGQANQVQAQAPASPQPAQAATPLEQTAFEPSGTDAHDSQGVPTAVNADASSPLTNDALPTLEASSAADDTGGGATIDARVDSGETSFSGSAMS